MKPVLSPHERYLVVRAKGGWSVNLGADELNVYSTRHDAREAADAGVWSVEVVAVGPWADGLGAFV